MKLRTSLTLTLLSLGLLGCQPPEETPPPEPTPPTLDTPAPPAETPAATASTFAWTETPTVAAIPDQPVAGEANGAPFEVKFICFEPGLSGWDVVLADKEFAKPTEIVMDCQEVKVSLGEEPKAGLKLEHGLAWGGGYWQIKQPADPAKTTSWNADNAVALELTAWEAAPYDKAGEMFQVAGKASGKIAVCYQGSGDFKDSWIAGTFTDVPVRYMGEPTSQH